MREEIALITGASDGIGREYALQLQARCKGMILVGQSAEKLQRVAAELKALAGEGLSLVLIATDLSTTLGQTEVMEAIRQKGPVSILVNNAGFALQEKVADCDLDAQTAMINLHCTAALVLCRAALPYMRQAGRGQLINVASLGAFLPMPQVAVYSATKAFLLSFSQSVAAEEAKHGIAVQCLCPGYTRSGFHDRERLRNFDAGVIPEQAWSSAQQVVAESLVAMDGDKPLLVMPGAGNREMALAGLDDLKTRLS